MIGRFDMHFTEPVCRNHHWPTWPLLEVTRGCTHNRCKFCTMYKGVRFGLAPMGEIEADLREIAATTPHARTIQLLGANPLVLSYDKMAPILEKIRAYLPDIECVYAAGRVTDIRNKTVGQLRELRDLGLREISMGTESGDDWTLDRVSKGYHAQDIVEQCAKLDEAHIRYWHTFLNGVAGRGHSREHAINSARVFSQTNPMVVGTGGLTLFPGTPLLDEAQAGEFDPLSEREMLEELLLFVENLDVDCSFITHHTIGGANLTGPDFLGRKAEIAAALRDELEHGDLGRMAALRRSKRTL